MDKIYTYIGAINPQIPSDNFALSLFINDDDSDDYYIQDEDDDEIKAFKKISTPILIKKVTEEERVQCKVGDEAVYSYITQDNELYFGTRENIEASLFSLFSRDNINVHAKLLISSFLKLYNQTLTYLDKANKDFEKNGVKSLLNEEVAFNKVMRPFELKFEFFDLVKTRYEKLHEIDPSIKLEDIAMINKDKAYFEDYFFELSDFFNRAAVSTQGFRKILTNLITTSYSNKRVDLEKLIDTNHYSYEFLLESDSIIFEQDDLERLLTSEIEKTEESIIDIGLQIDKDLYETTEMKFSNDKKENQENKDKIIESFRAITGVKPETINSW